jgi:beta-fructofuranosidase
VLRLPDHWVWDSWGAAASNGGERHLFFLRASRALLDPERRHDRASVGHAASTDLRAWTLLPDALVHADAPAWDDMAIWTGSIARGPDGLWRMFYTGRSHAERGLVQRIGVAVSEDLTRWTRGGLLLEADPRWYERLDLGAWSEEAWRDPHVFADPGGDGWHMLITARVPDGDPQGRGVIGHARSADLLTWEVLPPLTVPAGFGHLEVPCVAEVDGRPVLMFSCWPNRMDARRRSRWTGGGVYVVPGEGLLGPWDMDGAAVLEHPSLYAGQLVRDGTGAWAVLGFRDTEDGVFAGEILDPLPIEAHGDTVRLAAAGGPPAAGGPR